MHFPDIQQPSNIYIPGLPGLGPDPALDRLPRLNAEPGGPVYTDDELIMLPDIAPDNPRYRYWRNRKTSTQRLTNHLAFRDSPMSILEVGCGNGWLSFQLSTIPGTRVIGLDCHYDHLQQAARVFKYQPNLKFMYGDFCSDLLQGLTFDTIVFGASIHRLPTLKLALDTALGHLSSNGEIHILDTPAACLRGMQDYRHKWLYNPRSLWNRLRRKNKGLPWIVVTKG